MFGCTVLFVVEALHRLCFFESQAIQLGGEAAEGLFHEGRDDFDLPLGVSRFMRMYLHLRGEKLAYSLGEREVRAVRAKA